MTKAKTKRKTTKALSERALFEMASDFESAKERAKKYETDPKVGWRSIQSRIVDELKRRKTKSLTASDSLMKVTLVQAETVVYHEDDLWSDLKPSQRKLVFDRTINLAKLPAADQAALLKHLTPTQRKNVVGKKLNVDKLAQAVQDKKVDVEMVSEHSEIKPSSPYITVSRGEAS